MESLFGSLEGGLLQAVKGAPEHEKAAAVRRLPDAYKTVLRKPTGARQTEETCNKSEQAQAGADRFCGWGRRQLEAYRDFSSTSRCARLEVVKVLSIGKGNTQRLKEVLKTKQRIVSTSSKKASWAP
jgi:hypothetical protein